MKLKIKLVSLILILLAGLSFAQTISEKSYPQQYATPEAYAAAGGAAIAAFNEAPMLAEKVTAGELPAVAERLPLEPLVIEPLNEIGVYGGELVGPTIVPSCCGWDELEARMQKLFTIDTDLRTIIPNIAKGIEVSEDQMGFTISLREGHKWSDGEPFTAEDFRFYYEDVLLNEELTPAPSGPWVKSGEPAKFEVVDETTIRYTFAEAHPSFVIALGEEFGNGGYRPAHYFKQFHITYNENADTLAKEQGFADWKELFNAKMTPYNWTWDLGSETDAYSPTLNTFVFAREDSFGNKYYERNPYFFKVDIAGNQLPYTDTLKRVIVEDLQVQDLKAIAGEFSHFGWGSLLNVPTYRENEAAGNYRTALVKYDRGNEFVYTFNFTDKDPVLREIFWDVRFRQAMSLAINCDEINQLVYFGLALPSQAAPTVTSAFYEPWMTDYFANYDPEKANQLLDEMGLDKRGADGFRLRRDGEPLFLNLQTSIPEEAWQKIAELTVDYWNAIGVKSSFKLIEEGLYQELRDADDLSITAWGYDVTDIGEVGLSMAHLRPDWGSNRVGQAWEEWFRTNGAEGEEPPAEIKDLWEFGEQYLAAPYNSEDQIALGKELYKKHYEALYMIGTIQGPPQPLLIKANLCNTPPNDTKGVWTWSYRQWIMFMPEQWYFKPDGSCS